MFARENLPKIDYKPRIEIMTPLLPGIIGKKMSASEAKSKIDILDDEKTVKAKIKSADMIMGNPENFPMVFLKNVIMVLKGDKKEKFVIKRDKKFGGDLEYTNYPDIEKDFITKKIHPLDLKMAVAEEINKLLKPIQKNKKELEKLASRGYK